MTRLLIPAVLLTLLLPACFSSGPPQQKHYYHLQAAGAPRLEGTGPRVALRDFVAAPGYDSVKLTYRVSPHEIRYYEYRQWVAEPTRLLATATERHLRASGYFASVDPSDQARDASLILEATVEAIEEVDQDDRWEARLAMTFVVRQGDSGRLLFRHAFDERARCLRRHPDDVIAGLSAILARQVKQLAGRMARAR